MLRGCKRSIERQVDDSINELLGCVQAVQEVLDSRHPGAREEDEEFNRVGIFSREERVCLMLGCESEIGMKQLMC